MFQELLYTWNYWMSLTLLFTKNIHLIVMNTYLAGSHLIGKLPRKKSLQRREVTYRCLTQVYQNLGFVRYPTIELEYQFV